jgi:hypothetical protein
MRFAALHMSVVGTSRTSRDVRLESAKWAKADIDQVARFRREQSVAKPGKPSRPKNDEAHRHVLALMLAATASRARLLVP